MEKGSIHYAHPSHSSHWPTRYILFVDIKNFDYPLYSHFSPFSLPMSSKKVLEHSLSFPKFYNFQNILYTSRKKTLRFKNIVSASRRSNKLYNHICIYVSTHSVFSLVKHIYVGCYSSVLSIHYAKPSHPSH